MEWKAAPFFAVFLRFSYWQNVFFGIMARDV